LEGVNWRKLVRFGHSCGHLRGSKENYNYNVAHFLPFLKILCGKKISSFLKIREFLDCRMKYQLKIWTPLGYYAVYSGNSLPTFRDKQSVPSTRINKVKKNLEVMTNRLSRNVGKEIPLYA